MCLQFAFWRFRTQTTCDWRMKPFSFSSLVRLNSFTSLPQNVTDSLKCLALHQLFIFYRLNFRGSAKTEMGGKKESVGSAVWLRPPMSVCCTWFCSFIRFWFARKRANVARKGEWFDDLGHKSRTRYVFIHLQNLCLDAVIFKTNRAMKGRETQRAQVDGWIEGNTKAYKIELVHNVWAVSLFGLCSGLSVCLSACLPARLSSA